MASERLIGGNRHGCLHMDSDQSPEPARSSSFFTFDQNECESTRIFDELPRATIVQVSRPDAGDISPLLLSYTIELQYKQVPTSRFR